MIKCTCGNNKDVCIDCMQDFIENAQKLHAEVKDLCNWILDGEKISGISGRIESKAFEIGHHPFILNPVPPSSDGRRVG